MDLKPFCSKSGELSEPFSDGEYSYATDGFVLIRIPRQSDIKKNLPVYVSKLTNKQAVNLETRNDAIPYFNHDSLTDWIDMPVLPDRAVCKKCNGAGVLHTCCECDGSGTVGLENEYNSYNIECASCDGSGKADEILCNKCEGEGKVSEVPFIEFVGAGMRIATKYLYKIKDLPGIQLSISGQDWTKPVRFRFTGGAGLLQCY